MPRGRRAKRKRSRRDGSNKRPRREEPHGQQQQPERPHDILAKQTSTVVNHLKSMDTLEAREQYVHSEVSRLCNGDAEVRQRLYDVFLMCQVQAAPYYEVLKQADSYYQAKEFHRAAELYWKIFKQASKWGGRWSPGRIFSMVRYAFSCIYETERDVRRLKRCFHDQHEVTTIRMIAAWRIHYMPDTVHLRAVEKREIVREALLLDATPEEHDRHIYFSLPETSKTIAHAMPVLAAWRSILRECVSEWENPATKECVPKEEDADLFRRTSTVGGGECDFCHTTVEELGVTKLKFCSQCQNAFYCGPDCQHKAWKKGHKNACKPLGCCSPGDIMRLLGFQRLPRLNGRLVRLVTHNADSYCWEVHLLSKTEDDNDSTRIFDVETKYLEPIRPAA